MAGLVLTTRDEDLFRALWMLRVMTVDQLRRMAFYQPKTGRLSNLNNTRMRLKRLEDAGYLRGELVRHEHSNHQEKVYFLDQPALKPLERFGVVQNRISEFKALHTHRQIYHALMVSECGVRMWESVRQTDIPLPKLAPFQMPFYHTHAVANRHTKKHVERFITQVDVPVPGKHHPYRVRPDLIFGLERSGLARLFFLEADRGFEGHQEIAAKLEGYVHYARLENPDAPGELAWHQYGLKRDFRVLFVTTTERRLQNLWDSLHTIPGFELWAMTTFDALKNQNPILDTIWKTADGSLRALMRSS